MSHTSTRKTLLQRYQQAMPKGAGALCLIQIFSTLSFSVLYSTLILYATNALHLSDTLATSITGSFVALNYFLHLLGGYIGGRLLSNRSLFNVGMMLQVAGCVLISIPDTNYLLWGLSAFLGGSGINVTCINCMVTQLFDPNDKNRETAFLWNYSGMNIGFFIGFGLGGMLHLHHAYRQLFLISGFGNLIAVALVLYNWKILKDRDTLFDAAKQKAQQHARYIGLAMLVALVLAIRFLLEHTTLCNNIIMIIGAAMFVLAISFALKQDTQSGRNKIFAFIILALSAMVFWTLYQLAPMGLNLFIERNVDRHVLGMVIAPQWIQNINTVVIIIGGPILGSVFSRMRENGKNITLPMQFSIALLLIGIAFAILPLGIYFADDSGYVNFSWVAVCYILQSSGELFIAPIGYAMVGELAPVRLRGIMMGMWMMIAGIAAIMSNHFSQMALGKLNAISPLATNAGFSHTFNLLGWSSITVGILLLTLAPLIIKLTQEKKKDFFQDSELELAATTSSQA